MVQVNKRSKALLVTLMVTGMAGCVSGTGGYRPPVEDRAGSGGVVQSVEPAARGVDMSPAVVRQSRTEQPVAVPVPTPVTTRAKNPAVIALLDTVRCRKLAVELGFEKMSLKDKTLRCFFINRPDSPYFESETFRRILAYLQTGTNRAKLKQTGRLFLLVVDGIADMADLHRVLRNMHEQVFAIGQGTS